MKGQATSGKEELILSGKDLTPLLSLDLDLTLTKTKSPPLDPPTNQSDPSL